jgi:hypothetical protein
MEELREKITKILLNNTECVNTWINPDGEGIETDDRYLDLDDLNQIVEEILELHDKNIHDKLDEILHHVKQ